MFNRCCDLCVALQVSTESMMMLSCIGGRSGEIVISTNGHKMCQGAQNEDECTRRCIPWALLVDIDCMRLSVAIWGGRTISGGGGIGGRCGRHGRYFVENWWFVVLKVL